MTKRTSSIGKTSLALAIGIALAAPTALAGKADLDKTTGWMRNHPAKHIILFIGDGMQLHHEIATSRYLYGRDLALSFQRLPQRTNAATWDVTTYNKYAKALDEEPYVPNDIAANDPLIGYDPLQGGLQPSPTQPSPDDAYFVPKDSKIKPFATDSASAGTALSAGVKTDDGNIAWRPGDPEDGSLETIAETLRNEKGYAIGVVSTVPFSHATPAAFVSHNKSRNNYYAIAKEILTTTKAEVVIGGGHPGWAKKCANGACEGIYMENALHSDFADGMPGYVFVERKTGESGAAALKDAARQAADNGNKLFGLFGGDGGNFESPVPADAPGRPSVTRGSIENPLLAEAAVAALDVLKKDPDGFFVMLEQGDIDWANHANDFPRMIGTTWDLDTAVKAVVDYVNRPGDDLHWDNTLLIVTSDHGNSYMRLNPERPLGKGDLPDAGEISKASGGAPCPPGSPVCYRTGDHTNELVRVYAMGRGAELFRRYEGTMYPGAPIVDNTQIYEVMRQAAGL